MDKIQLRHCKKTFYAITASSLLRGDFSERDIDLLPSSVIMPTLQITIPKNDSL